MAIKLAVGETSFTHLKPRITVIGVGGGGGNAISNMMAKNGAFSGGPENPARA